MTPQEALLADAKLEELRPLYAQIGARIKQLEEAKAVPVPPSAPKAEPKAQGSELEPRLSKLPWKTAASGKCEYVKGTAVPTPLAADVKAAMVNSELQLEKFHYVVKPDGAILRFKRKG